MCAFPSPFSTNRILVVDDVADNSMLLQALLECEGYEVDTADSGHVALKKIKSTPPDLVLLDVMMPGMNGYEVAQQLQQNRQLSDIPILFVTGYDPSAIELEAVQHVGIIRKPIELDELVTQVQAALKHEALKHEEICPATT